ncbi:MAG: hypothetical protein JW874_13015 [Spirochaetales bacterium]|nr:hypothetical protein [Spirochaetales bacterium]
MELDTNIRIRNFETDLNGNCSLPVIADLFQGIAEEHAGTLGFGYNDMIAAQQAWVLSRMLIRISTFPGVGESLKLRTWPKGTEKLFALRDYTLSSGKNVLVAATSAWIIINSETRRIVKPEALFSRFTGFITDNAVPELPGKIAVPETHELQDTRKVRYTDIDINNHMNNSRYLRWALDMFPVDVFSRKTVQSFLINYTSELVFGDEVALFASETGEGKWTVWGEKNAGGNGNNTTRPVVFAAEIVWA